MDFELCGAMLRDVVWNVEAGEDRDARTLQYGVGVLSATMLAQSYPGPRAHAVEQLDVLQRALRFLHCGVCGDGGVDIVRC